MHWHFVCCMFQDKPTWNYSMFFFFFFLVIRNNFVANIHLKIHFFIYDFFKTKKIIHPWQVAKYFSTSPNILSYVSNNITKRKTHFWLVFTTKIHLVALNKLHVILVTNNKRYWMKEKSTNTKSSFESIVYIYCHIWIICNYFGHNWEQMMCCHLSQYLLFKLLLLLFWNNLGCSIQMFGWSYMMTHGLMEICHVAFKNEFH